MARQVFWAQVAKMQFISARPQVKYVFWDFIILFDLSYSSGKNEVLFVKIGTGVLDLWLKTTSDLVATSPIYLQKLVV